MYCLCTQQIFIEWKIPSINLVLPTHSIGKKIQTLVKIHEGANRDLTCSRSSSCGQQQEQVVGVVAGTRTSGAWSPEDDASSSILSMWQKLVLRGPNCHSYAAESLSRRPRSHTAAGELARAARLWSVAVGGRPGDGADEDGRLEMGNEEDWTELEWQIIRLQQHYQRALKVRVEAVKTASGFILLPPGK
jgi:hypothetical protein